MKNNEIELTSNIKIQVPEGFTCTLEDGIYKIIPIENKPKRLEISDLGGKKGWFIDNNSDILEIDEQILLSNKENANLSPHRYLCEAYLALLECIWLSEHESFNGQPQYEWADWTDVNQNKYCITPSGNKNQVSCYCGSSRPLAFKTEKLAEKFLNDYNDLLEIAKPLL